MRAHAHAHRLTHAHMHTHVHPHPHAHTQTRTCGSMCLHAHGFTHTRARAHTQRTQLHTLVCTHAHTATCAQVHTHTHGPIKLQAELWVPGSEPRPPRAAPGSSGLSSPWTLPSGVRASSRVGADTPRASAASACRDAAVLPPEGTYAGKGKCEIWGALRVGGRLSAPR